MTAWYYYRGKLEPVTYEHPAVVANVYRGKARLRYYEFRDVLAVQARSLHIVRAAIACYLDDPQNPIPDSIEASWPGRYWAGFIQDWK